MAGKHQQLRALLSESDSDSLEWIDGGGADLATALLDSFQPEDWQALRASHQELTREARFCLVAVLNPGRQAPACELLIELAMDSDFEVKLSACRAVSFYCGVNEGRDGLFHDPSISVADFLAQVRSNASLRALLDDLTARYVGGYAGYIRLLHRLLDGYN